MFVVYWMEKGAPGPRPECRLFDKESLLQALSFMEQLRVVQRTGERQIAFITMSSENPDVVGKAGAADPDAAYAWTKRRGNRPRARRELAQGDFEDH